MALSVEDRLAPIAARERAAMEAGATLDEVLHRLKHEDELRSIEQFVVLRMIKHVGFGIAKEIVADHRDLALDLDDLALLASVPQNCKLWWLPSRIEWAIVERDPHTLIPRGDREAFMSALEDPAWRREIAIERDDEQGVYIRFVRVPRKRAAR